MKLLTICIPTLTCRRHFLDQLLSVVTPQLCDEVELIIECDDGQLRIGAKRKKMLERATGRFIANIDDDDLVASDYVERILIAAESDPLSIGFNGIRTCDGIFEGNVVYSCRYGLSYTYTPPNFVRPPTPVTPVRRSIVVQTEAYTDADELEDQVFSARVLPLLSVERESFIDGDPMYFYRFRCIRTAEVNEIQRARR